MYFDAKNLNGSNNTVEPMGCAGCFYWCGDCTSCSGGCLGGCQPGCFATCYTSSGPNI